MDWSNLNKQFENFHLLCNNLLNKDDQHESKINLKKINYKIDIPNRFDKLILFTIILPTKIKPISYLQMTNHLIDTLMSNKYFSMNGTILRTLEKAIVYPVIHYENLSEEKLNQDYIKLISPNELGCKFVLHQGVYKELCCINIPFITKLNLKCKFKKNNTLNYNHDSKEIKLNKKNQSKDDTLNSLISDTNSIDSGCIFLNYQNDKSFNTNDEDTLDSGFINDSDNDMTQKNILKTNLENSSHCSLHVNCEINLNNELSKKYLLCLPSCKENTNENDINKIYPDLYSSINEGHLIIGYRIRDEFENQVFEENWIEMSGIKYMMLNVASTYGLRKIKFLKRIGYNYFKDDNNLFIYILHVEFTKINKQNEIFFTSFVHRLRLRNHGSITIYTNIN